MGAQPGMGPKVRQTGAVASLLRSTIEKLDANYEPNPTAPGFDDPITGIQGSGALDRRQWMGSICAGALALALQLGWKPLVNLCERFSRFIPSITHDERKFILGLVDEIKLWSVVQDPSKGVTNFIGTSPSEISLTIQLREHPNNVREYSLSVSSGSRRGRAMPISFTGNSGGCSGDIKFIDNLIAAVQKSSGATPSR